MCTRFYADMKSLSGYISEAQRLRLAKIIMNTMSRSAAMSGEIRPTDMAAVIAPNKKGEPAVFPMIWGFTPKASPKPVINCRIETADQKELWKDSWFRRRCIIPASWYFEWEHLKRPDGKVKTGQKYAIQPKGSSVTWIAGLYRMEEKNGLHYPVFTVLTREPSAELRKLHNRMPVILPESVIDDWLLPGSNPEEIINNALTDMVIERTN